MNIKAIGLISKSANGDILDVFFPVINFNGKKTEIDNLDNIESSKEIIELSWNQDNLDEPVNGVVSAYLKLHLLSYKFVKPNSINLDGLFSSLPNIAWTNQGPVSLDEIDEKLLESKNSSDNLYIRSLDKFPCLTDYIIPKNVRIADASRVRLGAYLSSGTTVMHEGFVNFNAGTLGKAMIEGRISAGVVIGDNSDLGGGCSTMGTLSGGNDIKISVGKNCLLGANSGIGIPLGDNCTVEAGLYITSGTKIQLHDTEGNPTIIKKGLELANSSDLVFLRNSINGMVIAKPNKKSIQLNTQLHTND
ncbi:2,3,4,5-tetrahydropyridine-2,6-carboxylate N-succinyltransferase [Gammaproteobacteria bacterium]|jgi:2,3,4,5-tetrahydropyridine-2-carboxylate N-succinyltransferase|nr:2,3,4,5-tetrahydropyridine-2,6-carboxylate N-succinyltransferase [Gammaproteobacteria bacterium]MDA9921411.1 2,3,4,5-tetrahydropyridine-2,6-carboxylate N-succinyltransferase [Gammaproteobacteria bacterium]MDB0002727.1 2,3,4,5-tetrahydropyridine-2,6-carboxylate N-succinyltransferase [Gammaproteobacteria bacterium]MDB2503839.1 2,3,4,5-tetrahydropyridine-2,6-carboxylate N-succinyltransferase [Gammaproteobacteria bacterium]MDB2604506.1 2,3,4,5-tetrahydropyridine-2,6-carboxylate N-succinyltransfe